MIGVITVEVEREDRLGPSQRDHIGSAPLSARRSRGPSHAPGAALTARGLQRYSALRRLGSSAG